MASDRAQNPEDAMDRNLLPRSNEGVIRPPTPMEALVAATWCHVLKLEEVSLTDNFFEVGGHSLAAARVVHEIGAQTGVQLELEAFFDLDTLQQVAAEIDRRLANQDQDESQIYEGEL
jgi:acyl carrier protein